jgi:hypothetical protein
MSLSACDAEPYIRLKEKVESRPTNSNAVYSNGKVLPVFIYSLGGKDVFVIEGEDYKFYPAQQVPGWIRWENKPDAQPQAAESPAVESTKIKGSSWTELRQSAQEQERKARVEQRSSHQAQQGAEFDSPLARASRKHAQDVASRLRPQR